MLAKVPGASNATVFFRAVMSKPYINQIVLAPHLYCPAVRFLLPLTVVTTPRCCCLACVKTSELVRT